MLRSPGSDVLGLSVHCQLPAAFSGFVSTLELNGRVGHSKLNVIHELVSRPTAKRRVGDTKEVHYLDSGHKPIGRIDGFGGSLGFVAMLLCRCSPSAVFGEVAKVIVDAVKGLSGRAFAHVKKEVFE